MRKQLFHLLKYSGFPFLFRKFIQSEKVTILMFHEIDRSTADKCLTYLQKNYNIIDLNLFIRASVEKTPEILPENSLIITFDDGHKSNYEMVKSFQERNVPLTIFLCSHIINTNRKFWFKFGLERGINNQALKELPNNLRLQELEKFGFDQEKEYDNSQALSKIQLREMQDVVNFQSHTCYHPCLPNCDNNDILNELESSKKILEEEYEYDINAIAYPNGDYSEKVIEISKQLGYSCGLTIDHGFNTCETDLFRLKRFSVNDTTDLNEFIVKSSGLWSFMTSFNGLIKPGYHK